MKKIVLIGFAACYKTSVGRLLSDRLKCDFVDTDQEIERICNRSVQQIFEEKGEQYFRQKESELLRALKANNTVVACGGGAVLSAEFDSFARDSVVICLTAQTETVRARLGSVARPLYDGRNAQELNSLMQQRAPLYAKYANVEFATDGKTSEQVTNQIYEWLNVTSVVD